MRLLKKVLFVFCVPFIAALLCLIVYSVSGPRDVPLRRIVPEDAQLCLTMMDLDAHWPGIASSDLGKRMVRLGLVHERVSFFRRFLGREALAFYSPAAGLCAASRLSTWQRGAELLLRLWFLMTDGEWSRQRYRGIDLVRVESRKDRPAFMYLIYGDLGFLMIGAEPSQMKGMVDLILGKGGWGAEALADFAPSHFISLYLRPGELLEFDLKGEYEKAKKRYREQYLPSCWEAVEEINSALVKNVAFSLLDIYSRVASSLDKGEEILASLDMAGDNAVMEWRRTGAGQPPPPVGACLMAYAAILPDSVVGVAAFRFDVTAVPEQGPLPVSIMPVDVDVRDAYEQNVEEILSSIDGSAALAVARPSLFSSILPACLVFKLEGTCDISTKINALLDTIAGREIEVRSAGFTATGESKLGHRKKSYGGYEYFILEKSKLFVWSYAQLDDFLIIATHNNLIKSMIDAAREPGKRLSSSKRFMGAVEAISGRGEAEGFLDLKTLASYAGTALDLYAVKEALILPQTADEKEPVMSLRSLLEILECVGNVAWEGGAGGGRIVIPMTNK